MMSKYRIMIRSQRSLNSTIKCSTQVVDTRSVSTLQSTLVALMDFSILIYHQVLLTESILIPPAYEVYLFRDNYNGEI